VPLAIDGRIDLCRAQARSAKAVNSSPTTQPAAEAERLHFLDYWQIITKRKEVIIATAVILILAVTGYSFVVQPQYTATSQIRIDSSAGLHPFVTGDQEDYYAQRGLDEAEFNTHLRQISSSPVLQRVIEGKVTRTVWRCDLCGREYSRSEVLGSQLVQCTREGCGGHLRRHQEPKYPEWVNLREKWAEDDHAPEPYSLQVAISMLRGRISVNAERRTRLINISYTSPDKTEVAMVANLIAEVYMQYQEEQGKERVDDALAVLLEEIDSIQRGSGATKGLRQLTDEMYQYKHDNRLLINQAGVIEQMDLNSLRARLIDLDVTIVGLEERLNGLRRLGRDEQIAALQGQEGLYTYKRMLQEQKITLNQALIDKGKDHPEVQRIQQSINDLEAAIDLEVAGILNNMQVELDMQKSRREKLQATTDEVEKEIFRKEDLLSQFMRKSEEVNRTNTIYSAVVQKKTTEFIKQAIPSSRVTITQEASPPSSPSKPNRLLNIIIGVIVGLTVGTGLAYFIEYLDTSVKTIDDLERSLNMPILGVIPQRVKLLTEVTHKSPAYEAYRMLWTNIEFARQDSKLHTLLVTSGGVGEGKTTSLVNLAIVIAREGNRVLVVDSDFRRPRVHKLLGVPNQAGLTDVLLHNVDPDRVALETSVPNLYVLPSGKLPPNAMGLLNSRNMRECIEYLHDRYDIILFDSPPVIGVSDASVLAGLVDRIVLVVEYRKYPKSVAIRAKKILENVGGHILGGIINNLNIIKEDYYYYSQVYHYFQSSGEQAEAEETPGKETKETPDAEKPDDEKGTA
jgi:succinoglycan biosynthesis transport protein ExoP